jgi:hypothetical protein
MVTLAIFAALCGAVLAFRFRVAAVVAAIAVVWVAVLFVGVAAGIGGWTIALAMVVTASALQIGYFAGGVARISLASARAGALRRNDAASEEPRRV